VRTAILLSIIPGLLAALAIVYAVRHLPRLSVRERQSPSNCGCARCSGAPSER
jgi:hypothetical protein